jgi:hypothetical protein
MTAISGEYRMDEDPHGHRLRAGGNAQLQQEINSLEAPRARIYRKNTVKTVWTRFGSS